MNTAPMEYILVQDPKIGTSSNILRKILLKIKKKKKGIFNKCYM